MAKVRPIRDIEREALTDALEEFHGDKIRAADALGVSVRTVYAMIHRYGLEKVYVRPYSVRPTSSVPRGRGASSPEARINSLAGEEPLT